MSLPDNSELDLMKLTIGDMNSTNIRGPMTDPCGTLLQDRGSFRGKWYFGVARKFGARGKQWWSEDCWCCVYETIFDTFGALLVPLANGTRSGCPRPLLRHWDYICRFWRDERSEKYELIQETRHLISPKVCSSLHSIEWHGQECQLQRSSEHVNVCSDLNLAVVDGTQYVLGLTCYTSIAVNVL